MAYFYPRPPRGGRLEIWMDKDPRGTFLSTPSARRATTRTGHSDGAGRYFYPRPPRGGRPEKAACARGDMAISIHALREEGDLRGLPRGLLLLRISIHALREEGDDLTIHVDRDLRRISIHALREEGDHCMNTASMSVSYFYPRPPRGGRPQLETYGGKLVEFLSTPSARRATQSVMSFWYTTSLFLSTPSARRATPRRGGSGLPCGISIHALREEGDSKNRDKISIFKQIIQHSARI